MKCWQVLECFQKEKQVTHAVFNTSAKEKRNVEKVDQATPMLVLPIQTRGIK